MDRDAKAPWEGAWHKVDFGRGPEVGQRRHTDHFRGAAEVVPTADLDVAFCTT